MSDIKHAIKVINVLQTPPPLVPMGSCNSDVVVRTLKLKKLTSPEDNQIKARFVQELLKNMKNVDQSTIDVINSFVSNTEAHYVDQINTLSSVVRELKQTKDKLLVENEILNKKLHVGNILKGTPNFKHNMLDEIRDLHKKFLNDVEGLFVNQEYNNANVPQRDETLSGILNKVIHELQQCDDTELVDLKNPLVELYNLLVHLSKRENLQLDIDPSIDTYSPLIQDVNMGVELHMDTRINLNSSRMKTREHYGSILNEFCKYMDMCQERINEYGDRYLHQHVLNNNLSEVKKHSVVLKLQSIPFVDICNDEDYTPLHTAVMNTTSIEILKVLFKYGGDFKTLDGHGNTLLHLAVMHSTLETLINTEVLQHIDVNTIYEVVNYYNDDGYTALHLAAQHGKANYVRILLNVHADINAIDKKSGRTPIFHATENNHVEAIVIFLKNDADIHIKTYDGLTLLQALDSSESDFTPETKRLFYKDRMAVVEHKLDSSSDESETRTTLRSFQTKRRKVK